MRLALGTPMPLVSPRTVLRNTIIGFGLGLVLTLGAGWGATLLGS